MECVFCGQTLTKDFYTCPKCSQIYCSSRCYRSPLHIQCSEAFFKSCVEEEMRLADDDSVRSQSGQEKARKTQEALRRVMCQKGLEEEDTIDDDSDDELDLCDRMEGVDLDSPEAIWQNLTECERREFETLVESGEIEKVVPEVRRPWWDRYSEPSLVVEVSKDDESLGSKDDDDDDDDDAPPRVEDDTGKRVRDLIGPGCQPSELIKYGLANVLYGYAYSTKCLIDKDDQVAWSERFSRACLEISSNLKSGQQFGSFDVSLESAVVSSASIGDFFVSTEFSKAIKKDVFKLIRGPGGSAFGQSDHVYVLAALSDLKRILSVAAQKRASKSKTGVQPRPGGQLGDVEYKKLCRSAIKRVEFLLVWTREYYHEFKMSK